MSKTFEQGRDEIGKLCDYFARNRDSFLAPGVKEAHVRQTLIDPFLEALGWDVRNAAMVAPQYREVMTEDSLDVEGQQKAPDYTFRVGTLPKFYAEAKKCGVNLSDDPAPAYQLRRYGWSAKLALSILTDFEELAVYDCTLRPRQSDKAGHARVLYLRFNEYPDRWRELWNLFSREAVWSGAFDHYAASKRKRGTSEVDEEFLKEIEGWRDELARVIALRNRGLSPDDLNRAVQLTIDRIVFLRMAEDRGLEPGQQLLTLCERDDVYARFMGDLCRRADDKYNSGLFHFQREAGVSEDPDRITPPLKVDDKVFKSILQSLYFAYGSPYEFSVLPVEILGTVYERFLGKVIRLTADHRAKVEEKPEVRKAGGVYYTPAYIVDYIVQHTVGREIEKKSPAQLAGRNGKQPFRVLDMACGSGSFLLGAYQCLLDHCLKWYADNNPKKHKKAVYKDPRTGAWRLTIDEKKRILTTHLFGVDIDPQAVEVSKLSLLLKVLEGETDQSLHRGLLPFNDRALPNLADNIKCGNSLISPDYFTGALMPDAEEMRRVNAFDWPQGFPAIMGAGGFDCVIGNPPWGGLITAEEKQYLCSRYVNHKGEAESHLFFIERALKLLRRGGRLGFITPNTWLSVLNSEELRAYVLERARFAQIVELTKYIFVDAPDIVPVMVFLENRPSKAGSCLVKRSTVVKVDAGNFPCALESWRIRQSRWKEAFAATINLALTDRVLEILTKSGRSCLPLGSVARVVYGIKTGDNRKYLSTRKTARHTRKALKTGEVQRYSLRWAGLYLWWSRELAGYRTEPVEVPKIVVQYIRKLSLERRIIAALDSRGQYYPLNNYSCIAAKDTEYSLPFILGVLNSRLMNFVFANTFIDYNIKPTYLARLPIRRIDFGKPAEKARHDRLAGLVESMLALHKRLAAAKSEAQGTVIGRQIAATDAEIDRLVYRLYGLTKDEIAIVEETKAQA